jgi:hypothetical protein
MIYPYYGVNEDKKISIWIQNNIKIDSMEIKKYYI